MISILAFHYSHIGRDFFRHWLSLRLEDLYYNLIRHIDRCRMAGFSSRFATWLIKAVFSGMEYSPPALSSYRHARLVECGIDTQAGNKNRLSRVMFCLRYVNFISCPFRSLSHKPLLIQYSVNNKRLKNERNIQLVIFFCVLLVYGNGII